MSNQACVVHRWTRTGTQKTKCIGGKLFDTDLREDLNKQKARGRKIPNDESSGSSRRDVSNADLFGTATIPTVEISTMNLGKSAQGGVIYTVIYR